MTCRWDCWAAAPSSPPGTRDWCVWTLLRHLCVLLREAQQKAAEPVRWLPHWRLLLCQLQHQRQQQQQAWKNFLPRVEITRSSVEPALLRWKQQSKQLAKERSKLRRDSVLPPRLCCWRCCSPHTGVYCAGTKDRCCITRVIVAGAP